MRFMQNCKAETDGTAADLSEPVPTMGEQPEPQARQLQAGVRAVCDRPSDLFNGQTHIQRQKGRNRLTVYGIAGFLTGTGRDRDADYARRDPGQNCIQCEKRKSDLALYR